MRFAFKSPALDEMYLSGRSGRFQPNIARAFLRVVAKIAAAVDERDLRAMNALHMEKLRGDREGQYALRLNDQWRLIITINHDTTGRYVLIIAIVDYH